jgi:hypothetical protein
LLVEIGAQLGELRVVEPQCLSQRGAGRNEVLERRVGDGEAADAGALLDHQQRDQVVAPLGVVLIGPGGR